MRFIEMIISVCILALVLAVTASLLTGITGIAMETVELRSRIYEERQVTIDRMESSFSGTEQMGVLL